MTYWMKISNSSSTEMGVWKEVRHLGWYYLKVDEEPHTRAHTQHTHIHSKTANKVNKPRMEMNWKHFKKYSIFSE